MMSCNSNPGSISLCRLWTILHDHLRDVPWDDTFKLGASTTASKFCEWVQFEIWLFFCCLQSYKEQFCKRASDNKDSINNNLAE